MDEKKEALSGENKSSSSRFFTTKNIIIIGVIGFVFAIIIAAFYYFLFSSASNSGLEGNSGISQRTTEGSSTFSVQLEEIDESKQGGLATITEIEGKTSVLVELDAILSVDEQPANIYSGACPNPGDKVAFELNKIIEGRSETIYNENIEDFKSNAPFAIVVHKSDEEVSVNVSCGDI